MKTPNKVIPVAIPDLTGREEEYLLSALHSSWISSIGPFVAQFEKEFAALCGTRAAISVCNGTAALHLALLTLNAGAGDEVIVPSLTYVATANAVRYVGAEPIFADIDPQTWCIDPDSIEDAITARTKGIIAVHLYGHPADMDPINQIAAAKGLWVIEDAAEAPLATYKGRPVGGLSQLATFSFYGNKIFTSGEGGALTLSDPSFEIRARALRGQGMDPNRPYYFPITGYNFRLTNLACALLCAQFARRDQLLARRRQIFELYKNSLSEISGIGFQPVAPWARISPWLFCITINERLFGLSQSEVRTKLAEFGIDTRPFFVPLHILPPFCEASRRRGEVLPVTTNLAGAGLNLPTFTTMSDQDIEYISDRLAQIHGDAIRK